MSNPLRSAWGAAALMLFVGGAALWRSAHRGGPPERVAPPPPGQAPDLLPEPTVAVPALSAAPEDREESRRPPAPDSAQGLRDSFRAVAASDPGRFADLARRRLAAEAPVSEKAALLRAAAASAPALADELFAAAVKEDGNPALREAAAVLLLRDLRGPRPAPASWERLRAFVLGTRPGDPLRARAAGPLYAAAPADRLDSLGSVAERDTDPLFLREARRGLLRNPLPRARELAEDLARRGVEGPGDAMEGNPDGE